MKTMAVTAGIILALFFLTVRAWALMPSPGEIAIQAVAAESEFTVKNETLPEYRIDVRIDNNKKIDLLFDKIWLAFIPKQGQVYQYNIDHPLKYLTKRKNLRQNFQDYYRLPAGKHLKICLHTAIGTPKLLALAGDEPLDFVVVLFYHQAVMAGPFSTTLPPLKTLPKVSDGNLEGKGYGLKFMPHDRAKPLAPEEKGDKR